MKRKLFSFNEVPLSVPVEWDLRNFFGNAVQGQYYLDDGKEVVLHATWEPAGTQTLNDRQAMLLASHKGAELRKEIEIDARTRILLLRHPSGEQRAFCLILQEKRSRFVQLNILHTSGDLQGLIRTLIKPLPVDEMEPLHPWRFFGTSFVLSSDFRLEKAELNLGCAKLVFGHDKARLVVWDLSLMDRVASQEPLAQLARTLAEKQFPKRYRFSPLDPNAAPDAPFNASGRIRFHWRLSPLSWLFGNNKVRMHGVANPVRNHYTILLLEYRKDADAAHLDPLVASLREDIKEESNA